MPLPLVEFLTALGHMAAEGVLQNYREGKGFGDATIKFPGGSYRTPIERQGTLGGEDGKGFAHPKARVRKDRSRGSHATEAQEE